MLVCRSVYLRLLIIKLRLKISYIAMRKNMTITELFASAILRAYKELVD